MSAKDGGPAFPAVWENGSDNNLMAPDGQLVPPGDTAYMPGMSLRDYFATHSTQPGISEIAAMAGKVWRINQVWNTENSGVSFEDWWETIPLSERLALSARVRYAQADAMLKARTG